MTKGDSVTRHELEELWERATGLSDGAEPASLSRAIITEALEGGGDGLNAGRWEAVRSLTRLVEDVNSLIVFLTGGMTDANT